MRISLLREERFSCALPSVIDELLRPVEVCRMLGVSRTWLYDAAKSGRIPSVRIGGPCGPVRFVREDLEAWLDEARRDRLVGGLVTRAPTR